MTLTPAYGRDYKSKAEVLKDFLGGKDFIDNPSGKYCSVRDCKGSVTIRYGQLRKVVILKQVGDTWK